MGATPIQPPGQQPHLATQQISTPVPSVSPNPLSYGGQTCASELDYDRGFHRLFLPGTAAEEASKFRVDITSFHQDLDSGNSSSKAKQIVDTASKLRTALKDIPPLSATSANQGSLCHIRSEASGNGNVTSPKQSALTIISIPQKFSGGPLSITRAALKELIQQLEIPATFLPILYAFGTVPRISEAGLDCFTTIEDPSDKESFLLSYLYRFKDQDSDAGGNLGEWKDRQIGVFHKHCASTRHDLFIILQPHSDSRFDECVEYELRTSRDAIRMLMENSFCLHQLVISSYFENWRLYLKDVADEFSNCSAEAFSQDIVKDYSLEFNFLQRWRNTADNVVPISATLDSIRRIVGGLKGVYQSCISHGTLPRASNFDIFLQLTLSQANGLYQSSRALEKRIENIADLLTNTIETKNQIDAAKLNRHMERLTLDNVDDSTSVKIITYLSLVYLPGSFVGTLLGMNLFGFDSSTQRMSIAKNFWLYVAIFLPLTAVTSGLAWVLKEKAKKKRDSRNRRLGVVTT